MPILKAEGNCLIREQDGEKLWIEAWGENGLRVRATQQYQMEQSLWALLPPSTEQRAVISIDGQKAEITNGKITASVSAAGKITFKSQQKVLLEEYVRTKGNIKEFCSSLNIKARDLHPILGGDYSLSLRFESFQKEKLFGMGQYQHDIFNLKGATLELAQRNSQASVPFLLSDRGYGFLWNNPAIGRATFGTNLTEWTAHSTKQLDYWVTAGDTPVEIMKNYAAVTGKPPMMPDFAMGFWQSKLRYRTQQELLSVAREYKRRGLPLSVIVLDYFHWNNQGTWDFDPEYFPDPKAMVDELTEMGVELMVSVWPTVDDKSKHYAEMKDLGYLTRTDRGVRTQKEFKGSEAFYDTTNPQAREYVWQKVKQNYFDLGIRLFWLDVAEPEYTAYDFDLYRYSLGSCLQVGNSFPAFYTKGFSDGLNSQGIDDPILLVRCAWAGSQRYGALVWSGDIDSSFASMKTQIMAGLNMSVAGIPWWTTDIGGFHGGNPDDPAFRECLIRWFQYGAFCPVFRLHGDRQPTTPPLSDKVGGGMCETGADNEVWSYGEEAYGILTYYMGLREKLRPYVKGLMERAHLDGTPPMRPLFVDFPQDQATWEVSNQYMFGPDLLVCPVTEPQAREREVYLPTGTRWIEALTGGILDGGQTVRCAAPLERMPVFVREQNPALAQLLKG